MATGFAKLNDKYNIGATPTSGFGKLAVKYGQAQGNEGEATATSKLNSNYNEEWIAKHPIAGTLLTPFKKFGEWYEGTAAGKFNARASETALDTMSAQEWKQDRTTTGNKIADAAATGLGMIGGFGMSPASGASLGNVMLKAGGAGEVLAGRAIAKGVPKLAEKILPTAAKGAAGFGAYEGLAGLAQNEDAKGIAKRALMGVAMGAVLDPVIEKALFPALKTVATKAISRFKGKKVNVETLAKAMGEDIGVKWENMNERQRAALRGVAKEAQSEAERSGRLLAPVKGEGELPKPSNTVVLDGTKEKYNFTDAWKKFYTRIVDTQKPIADFSGISKDKTATLASNARNVNGTVNYILRDGLVDRSGNKIGRSLKELADDIPKGQEKEFWEYFSQLHNIDRAREGKNVITNYTAEMSQKYVSKVDAAKPQYKKVAQEFTNWIDTMMKEWGVSAGTVDDAVYKELRTKYKNYFPTQREFSQLEKSIPDGVRKSFVDTGPPIKKATGSARDINNPIENIMNLVNRTVKTARYNEVGQTLLGSIRQNPEKLKQFAEVITPKEGMFSNLDNVVTVMEGGKPVYLQINNQELLKAMQGLPKIINNAQAVRKVTNVFKSLITQKNPFFAIRNVARDIPTSYIYGSESNPLKFAQDLGKAGKDIVTNSENLQKYKAVGGGMSNFFTPAKAEEAAKQLTQKEGLLKKAGNAIEYFNNMTETAPRLAEFNRILERTGDVQQALAAANNVTVNFARGGDITKAAEPFVPYLNAGVQGLDRFFRSFKNPKTALATLAKGGAVITTPEVALYLINRDDPAYQQLDNRTKDAYYLIPKGDGKFIKIAKSRELGVLFASLFQRIARTVDGDKESFKGFGGTVATNLAPQNPLSSNIGAPMLINLARNKDFANRSIVPLGMQMDKRSPYLQYDERSSEIAKAIGEAANKVIKGGLSPKQIDYLIDSYTGVIGDLLLPATTKGASTIDTLSRQFVSDPLYSNEILNNFYTKLDELSRTAKDRNILEKINTKIVTPEEKARNAMQKVSDGISALQKQKSQAQAVGDKAKVDELQQQILNKANQALKK